MEKGLGVGFKEALSCSNVKGTSLEDNWKRFVELVHGHPWNMVSMIYWELKI